MDDFASILSSEKKGRSSVLRNDDFRRLLTTSRAPASSGGATSAALDSKSTTGSKTHSFTHRGPQHGEKKKGGNKHKHKSAGSSKSEKKGDGDQPATADGDDDDDGFQENLNEILKNYRDRAAERRKGENTTDPSGTELAQLSSAYRAVPGNRRAAADVKERRRQAIQESKYLGGDMEHTHLVKGLDYSLLHKVRNEIQHKESVDDESIEAQYQKEKPGQAGLESADKITATITNSANAMVKSMMRILFKEEEPKKNELFGARRMAYVVEFDEEAADSDIPTTLLRSKQDCPIEEANADSATNALVIQKLTQVLAYLRADVKKKKKDKQVEPEVAVAGSEPSVAKSKKPPAGDSIYDDIGEYVPDIRTTTTAPAASAFAVGHSKRAEPYFEKPRERGDRDRPERSGESHRQSGGEHRRVGKDEATRRSDDRGSVGDRNRGSDQREHRSDRERDRDRHDTRRSGTDRSSGSDRRPPPPSAQTMTMSGTGSEADPVTVMVAKAPPLGKSTAGSSRHLPLPIAPASGRSRGDVNMNAADDSYAECYPGGVEMYNAANESDDEADYAKMDMGNRKGPVKRWDFDDTDQYEKYMESKEAMPKAAYQYGVKTNDGRKTRKTAPGATGAGGDKVKAKFDRQLNEINKMLEKKRKTGEDTQSDSKRLRY